MSKRIGAFAVIAVCAMILVLVSRAEAEVVSLVREVPSPSRYEYVAKLGRGHDGAFAFSPEYDNRETRRAIVVDSGTYTVEFEAGFSQSCDIEIDGALLFNHSERRDHTSAEVFLWSGSEITVGARVHHHGYPDQRYGMCNGYIRLRSNY